MYTRRTLCLTYFFLVYNPMVFSAKPIAIWQSLKKSNATFVKSKKMSKQRAQLPATQAPSCIVLSCADSRVVPEFIFKRPLGDFFVVRVAGNVVDNLVIDSIEFAVRTFGSTLILVLGHSQCGAVLGALDHLKYNKGEIDIPHDHYGAVLIPIEKSIVDAKIAIDALNAPTLAIQANVRTAANRLIASSEIIKEGIKKGTLALVGAEYSLETGAVTELFQAK